MNPFYRTIRTIFRPLLRIYNRMESRGLEHLPGDGPALVVANHHSYLDPFALGASAHRKLHFLVKRSQYEKWFARWFCRGMDAFPVSQDGSDQEALRRSLRLLKGGEVVALYPSGTRVEEEGPGEWELGVGLLARRAGVPVVPVAIQGTREAFPTGAVFPKPCRVTVVWGEPMSFPGEKGRAALEEFVARLRDRVGEMLEGGE